MWLQRLNLALTVLVRLAIAVNNTIDLYEQGRLLKRPPDEKPDRKRVTRQSDRS
jgi:hypothetical protein